MRISADTSLHIFFFLMIRRPPRSTLFPTRRSSDLVCACDSRSKGLPAELPSGKSLQRKRGTPQCSTMSDRKSTRLNSSHLVISYAVFCLKKKNIHKYGYLPLTG